MRSYTGKRALVVDDDATTRMMLTHLLEARGFAVSAAVDGAEAIHATLAERFDVITMDIVMPNVNGLDAIRAIQTVLPEIPIIIVTSRDDDEFRQAAAELGVAHYLCKPVAARTLYAAIAALLSVPPALRAAPTAS